MTDRLSYELEEANQLQTVVRRGISAAETVATETQILKLAGHHRKNPYTLGL